VRGIGPRVLPSMRMFGSSGCRSPNYLDRSRQIIRTVTPAPAIPSTRSAPRPSKHDRSASDPTPARRPILFRSPLVTPRPRRAPWATFVGRQLRGSFPLGHRAGRGSTLGRHRVRLAVTHVGLGDDVSHSAVTQDACGSGDKGGGKASATPRNTDTQAAKSRPGSSIPDADQPVVGAGVGQRLGVRRTDFASGGPMVHRASGGSPKAFASWSQVRPDLARSSVIISWLLAVSGGR